jgi:hypothetical protein
VVLGSNTSALLIFSIEGAWYVVFLPTHGLEPFCLHTMYYDTGVALFLIFSHSLAPDRGFYQQALQKGSRVPWRLGSEFLQELSGFFFFLEKERRGIPSGYPEYTLRPLFHCRHFGELFALLSVTGFIVRQAIIVLLIRESTTCTLTWCPSYRNSRSGTASVGPNKAFSTTTMYHL